MNLRGTTGIQHHPHNHHIKKDPIMITYRTGNDLKLDLVIELYRASTLWEKRPLDDRDRMALMLRHANPVVTAWDGERLVGMARSVSDLCYCTLLSDLVIRKEYQAKGIGRELIRRTRELGGQASIIVLAAPKAAEYYSRLGFRQHPQSWLLPPPRKRR
jgi:GNAT superfamily N-acetyltransferase